MLSQTWSRPACDVVALLGRWLLQEAHYLVLCLLVESGRSAFPLAVIEARGTFLVEAFDPFVDGRIGDLPLDNSTTGETQYAHRLACPH